MTPFPIIRRIIVALVLGLGLLGGAWAEETSLTPAERDWLEGHPDIRLGDDFAWPPFAFQDDKGAFVGISSGYIAALSQRLSVNIRPVPGLTWAQVIEKIKVGEIDMLPAVAWSKEREAFLNFTKPYITYPVVIATHDRGETFTDLASLAGRKVGVVNGYITHDLLTKDHPAITLVPFDNLAAGLKALEGRTIDAFVDNLGAITYESRALRLVHVKVAAATPYKFELSLAVRKDWPELARILDKSLVSMSSKEKAAIENTWVALEVQFGVDLKTLLLWGAPTVLSALVVIVVIGVWNRRLVREIAERKRAEAKLVESERNLARSNAELQQFSYAVSHDLQAPLGNVVRFLQLLQRNYAGRLDADADEFIGYAVEGAKHMTSMIRDLLDYSRLETRPEDRVAVNTGEAAHTAVRNLSGEIADAGAEVIIGENFPTVTGGAFHLMRVFQNLIGNAVKYRDPARPCKVVVEATQKGREWVFTVTDNGIGIDPPQFARLFKVFQRLHAHQQYEGNGIGLALVKRIVEQHGGRLWGSSEGVGKGCVFTFTLPVA
ncbi:MAG: hypothetical protein A2516_07500 [Alphaproteobacteria bacterium RIFOXYD12_FULL_60_8]|nr:MAG: hypothetical protein A2516_07500 [Alphaproteobacteria bacterium RIFOXYD12_FULL_60_8]